MHASTDEDEKSKNSGHIPSGTSKKTNALNPFILWTPYSPQKPHVTLFQSSIIGLEISVDLRVSTNCLPSTYCLLSTTSLLKKMLFPICTHYSNKDFQSSLNNSGTPNSNPTVKLPSRPRKKTWKVFWIEKKVLHPESKPFASVIAGKVSTRCNLLQRKKKKNQR